MNQPTRFGVLLGAFAAWAVCGLVLRVLIEVLAQQQWGLATALLLGVTTSASVGIWFSEHLWTSRRRPPSNAVQALLAGPLTPAL